MKVRREGARKKWGENEKGRDGKRGKKRENSKEK